MIDDEKLIRWSIKEILSKEGHQVDTAATFEEAVHLASNWTYCLIFSDFEIEQVNSIDALNRIRTLQPDAAIIILSALAQHRLESLLQGISVYSIIEKPFCCEKIASVASHVTSPDFPGRLV